jgi:hypothetical protein
VEKAALPKAVEDALHKTISALPDQLVTDTKLTSATKSTQDMEAKLQTLNEQIQAIKTEEKEKKEKAKEEKEKARFNNRPPPNKLQLPHAWNVNQSFRVYLEQTPAAAAEYSTDQLHLVSEAVSLLFASSPSKIKKEREALEQLKERKEERMEERAEEVAADNRPQDKVVDRLETKLNKMIAKLDKEMDKDDQRAHTLMSIIDTNHDGTFLAPSRLYCVTDCTG